jgi:hypothetical protein
MADETDLRADVNRAAHAKALIEDEMLTAAFAELRELYIKELLETRAVDSAGREKLYLAARIVPAVKANLDRLLMDGTIAAKQLANLEDDQKRNKR